MNPFSMSGAWGKGMTLVYDYVVASGMLPIYQHMIDELLAEHKNPILTVLDVGCGSGFATAILAQKLPQAHIIGVDLSTQAIVMAKDKYRHLANLEFQVGNAQDLTFSEQQFDLVISTGSIKHWPNPEQGVREMLRVLKKSGVSILVETDPVTSHQKALHFVEHWHYGFAQWPRLSSRYFRRYIAESSPSLAMMQSWFERAAGKVMQASPHATYPFNVIVAAIKE